MRRVKVTIEEGWQIVRCGEAWIAMRGDDVDYASIEAIIDGKLDPAGLRDMAAVMLRTAKILESK